MLWRQLRGMMMACCVGGLVLAMSADGRACCGLFSRCFGCGGSQTTYYSPPYVAPAYGCAPCGSCAPCAQPACGSCGSCGAVPCQTFYRPAPFVAYMPVTYPVVPYATYRVVYSNPYVSGCGCAPCGGCTSCVAPSPCASGACASGCGTSSYWPASGCSTCSAATPAPSVLMPTPADMSAPAVAPSPSDTPSTFAAPAPPAVPAPPAAPRAGNSTFQGPIIQGVPAMDPGPRDSSTPARPEGDNRTAALPVYHAAQFQLIPSASQPAPVYPASGSSDRTVRVETPVVDEGWRPVSQ